MSLLPAYIFSEPCLLLSCPLDKESSFIHTHIRRPPTCGCCQSRLGFLPTTRLGFHWHQKGFISRMGYMPRTVFHIASILPHAIQSLLCLSATHTSVGNMLPCCRSGIHRCELCRGCHQRTHPEGPEPPVFAKCPTPDTDNHITAKDEMQTADVDRVHMCVLFLPCYQYRRRQVKVSSGHWGLVPVAVNARCPHVRPDDDM
jgi:hypothetical protein